MSSIPEIDDDAPGNATSGSVGASDSSKSSSELGCSSDSFEEEPCGLHPDDDALFQVLRAWDGESLSQAIYDAIESISKQRIKERQSTSDISPLEVELDLHRPLFTVIYGLLFLEASEAEELAVLDEILDSQRFDMQDLVTLETLRVIRNRPSAQLKHKFYQIERKVLEK